MADPNVIQQMLGGSIGGGSDAASSSPSLDGGGKGAEALTDLAQSLGTQASKLTVLQNLSKQMWQLLPAAVQNMQRLGQAVQAVTQQTAAAAQALQRVGAASAGVATGRSPLSAAAAGIATGPGGISPAAAFPGIKLPDVAGKVTAALANIGKGPGKDGLDGGSGKPIRVIIAGPWPLMVEDVSGRKRSGTPQERAAKQGKSDGGDGSGMGFSALAAGAGAVGLMSGLAGAASPALFNTLAGSIKLVAGEIGYQLTPAIISAASVMQGLASRIRSIDADTRDAIATKLKFAGAVAGVAFAVGKLGPAFSLAGQAVKGFGAALVGVGLPGLAIGLGAAAVAAVYFRKELADMLPQSVVDRVTEFGGAAQAALSNLWDSAGPGIIQIGKAVLDFGGSLLQLGQAALPIVTDAVASFGAILSGVAPAVGAVLAGALKAAAGAIETFSSGLTKLNDMMGGGLGTAILLVTGGLYAWATGITVVTAVQAALATSSFSLAGAITAVTAAMAANPVMTAALVLAAGVAALAFAMGALGDSSNSAASAAKKVGEELAKQLAAAEKLQPILERMRGGGELTAKDARQAFTAEQESELRNAKDPRDQAVILGRIRNEARVVSGGKSLEQLDKEEAEQAAQYKRGTADRLNQKTGKWEKVGVSDEDARKRAAEDFAERKKAAMTAEFAERGMNQKKGIDFSGKPKEGVIGGAASGFEGVMAKAAKEFEEATRKAGLSGPGKGKDGKKDNPMAFAVTHSIAPTIGSMTDIRKQLLLTNVGQDDLQRAQLEVQKRTDTSIQDLKGQIGRLYEVVARAAGVLATGNVDAPNRK